MNVLQMVVGIALILLAVGAVIWSVVRTPENLRGFYGKMFALIAAVGVIGGIALIVLAVI